MSQQERDHRYVQAQLERREAEGYYGAAKNKLADAIVEMELACSSIQSSPGKAGLDRWNKLDLAKIPDALRDLREAEERLERARKALQNFGSFQPY